MGTETYFTIRETAVLSGASKDLIEKSFESLVIEPVMRTDLISGERILHLQLSAVVFFATLHFASLQDLPVRDKRDLWKLLQQFKAENLTPVEFVGGVILDLPKLAGEAARRAVEYNEAKRKYLVSEPEILGGTAVIRGTRITVYSVEGRLVNGESTDTLIEDYPEIPAQAFMAADIYARTHPLQQHPSGRPWRAYPCE